MRLLIHLFGVTTLRNPLEQSRINLEIQEDEGGEQAGRGAAMQWDTGGQGPLPWEGVSQPSEHRLTVSRRRPPEEIRWLEIKP